MLKIGAHPHQTIPKHAFGKAKPILDETVPKKKTPASTAVLDTATTRRHYLPAAAGTVTELRQIGGGLFLIRPQEDNRSAERKCVCCLFSFSLINIYGASKRVVPYRENYRGTTQNKINTEFIGLGERSSSRQVGGRFFPFFAASRTTTHLRRRWLRPPDGSCSWCPGGVLHAGWPKNGIRRSNKRWRQR